MKLLKLLESDDRMTIFKDVMKEVTAELMQTRSVAEINAGSCEDWSTAVLNRFHKRAGSVTGDDPEEAACDVLGHYFLKFRGRYYDAEVPEGVTSPRLLPLTSRLGLNDEDFTHLTDNT